MRIKNPIYNFIEYLRHVTRSSEKMAKRFFEVEVGHKDVGFYQAYADVRRIRFFGALSKNQIYKPLILRNLPLCKSTDLATSSHCVCILGSPEYVLFRAYHATGGTRCVKLCRVNFITKT